MRLELPKRFWHLYNAVWDGEGYSPDEDENPPEYTDEEIAGINELLIRMSRALPPAGPELSAQASSPLTPATQEVAGLAELHMTPQVLDLG